MIQRNLYHQLLAWKVSKQRKPLILRGARQVGKTRLLKVFGEQEYTHSVYLNFEEAPELARFFESSLEPKRILEFLSIYTGQEILPNETLIIFDEIQECPN